MTDQILQNQTSSQFIVTKSPKSPGISILLTLLLGSLGLFYSTIVGGLIMTFIFPPAIVILFFSAKVIPAIIISILYYPLCIYIGVKAVKNYNTKLISKTETKEDFNYSITELMQYVAIIAFAICSIFAISELF